MQFYDTKIGDYLARKKRVMLMLGSGMERSYADEIEEGISVKTKYGSAYVSRMARPGAYLIMRHGKGQRTPPHMINYMSNIMAAKKLGAEFIIATSAVGAVNPRIRKGAYVVVNDFIDFTKSPHGTFFGAGGVSYTDMSHPYSETARSALIKALKACGVKNFVGKGVYVCSEGPRYESPAEIRMYRALGGDVAGMTGVPEVTLANELGIQYATLSHVTNMGSGMQRKLSHSEVVKEMGLSLKKTKEILDAALDLLQG